MNREIKFRVWDNDQLKFYYFDLLNTPLIIAFGAPVMQFTGLLDKNGNEIYESDICKYHKNTNRWLVSYNFEVRFKNGAFYAYWEREMLGKLEQHWDLLSQKDMRNIRVVSNIHENPELLK